MALRKGEIDKDSIGEERAQHQAEQRPPDPEHQEVLDRLEETPGQAMDTSMRRLEVNHHAR
jgi:hypothetical protein